jgi:hypothetical protein
VGVPTPAWAMFFEGLANEASDGELRQVADGLLGRAIQLRGGTVGLPDWEPSGPERKLIQYLEKPRKPDHLERAMKNRKQVRGFVRALELLDRLVVLPAAKAIPIPKASLVKSQDLPGAEALLAAAEAARQVEVAPRPPPSATRGSGERKPGDPAGQGPPHRPGGGGAARLHEGEEPLRALGGGRQDHPRRAPQALHRPGQEVPPRRLPLRRAARGGHQGAGDLGPAQRRLPDPLQRREAQGST